MILQLNCKNYSFTSYPVKSKTHLREITQQSFKGSWVLILNTSIIELYREIMKNTVFWMMIYVWEPKTSF